MTANGMLYVAGGNENPLYVLHVYGTPYQMGYAQGSLMKPMILEMYNEFFAYIEDQGDANPYFNLLPEFLKKMIAEDGIEAALEYEVLITSPYVPKYFTEEIRGLADALGMPYTKVHEFNMFPELIKASCSIVGAWGNATKDGGLLHLRALDWGTTNPFRKFATLTVYHPIENSGNGHEFATLGWCGLLGSLTGYSRYVGAGEKVWIHYNGTDVRAGIPWNFLFRDMLQFDKSVEQAITRINNAHRTCSVFLGIGDHGTGNFKAVEYSHDRVVVFGDNSPFPGYAPTPSQHPLMNGVVYVDKHTQPSGDPCLASIIQASYGKIDVKTIIDLAALLQTGDMHAAIFDYAHDYMYVALASQTIPYPAPTPDPVQPAFNRQFISLNMTDLFNTYLPFV